MLNSDQTKLTLTCITLKTMQQHNVFHMNLIVSLKINRFSHFGSYFKKEIYIYNFVILAFRFTTLKRRVGTEDTK